MTEEFTKNKHRIHVYSNVQRTAYGTGFAAYETQITSKLAAYDDLNVEAIRFSSHPEESEFTFQVRNIKFSSFTLFHLLHLPFINLFAPLMRRTLNSLIPSKPEDVFIFYENKIPNIKLNGKIIVILHDIRKLSNMRRLDDFSCC